MTNRIVTYPFRRRLKVGWDVDIPEVALGSDVVDREPLEVSDPLLVGQLKQCLVMFLLIRI